LCCAGAFGYFEVTHDITQYCKANVFSTVGKRTPIAVRFSTVGEWSEWAWLWAGRVGKAVVWWGVQCAWVWVVRGSVYGCKWWRECSWVWVVRAVSMGVSGEGSEHGCEWWGQWAWVRVWRGVCLGGGVVCGKKLVIARVWVRRGGVYA